MDDAVAAAIEALLPRVAARLLADRRQLVAAESCTGGWVAKACTDLPGSSRWFRGGAVVYSNELKTTLLGVSPKTLAESGAVSEAVVREMAVGALQRLGGSVALAVSGIAGPEGGTAARPVGTVCFAWAERSAADLSVRTAVEHFGGHRNDIRQQAVARALQGLLAT
jgi:nicotinamide-nucleotide amidase